MTYYCGRSPCYRTTVGCVRCDVLPAAQLYPIDNGRAQAGCICPPTSEQTCRNPMCPRGGPPSTTRA